MSRSCTGPRPTRASASALAAAGALLLGLVWPGTAHARAVPEAGAPGIGDPYFPEDGNGGIDVLEYDIHDDYRFRTGRLRGWTLLTVRATQDLSSFNLDLLLPVRRVRVDGETATFTRPDAHELQITPAQPVTDGDLLLVRVGYGGRPGRISWDGESSWLADDREVVAMNQPHMAPWWFPANDHPRDKAPVDLHITVPRGKRVIANGRRLGRSVEDGRVTVHWRADEPMVPYNAFFAAGDFDVARGTTDGLPWYVAVSDHLSPFEHRASMRLVKRSAEVVGWLEGELGDYPFSTTGGVVTSLDPGFALENQTRPTYPALASGETWLLVHELAHQWFGDSVSVENWDDIWLNEGAATFMEKWYDATHGGVPAGTWLRDEYDGLPGGSSFWDTTVADPGPDHLFAWPVYLRGAMALQALRQRIGNDAYWTLLRTWLADRREGNGSTEQLIALAEEVSGEDLAGFFQAWVYAQEKPADTAENGLG